MNVYFTFGTNPAFPYGIDDYVVVIGADVKDCIKTFKDAHPNRPGSDAINCADYYGEHQWKRIPKEHRDEKELKEILISKKAYGGKPEGFDPIWFFVPDECAIVYFTVPYDNSGDSFPSDLTPHDVEAGYVDYLDYNAYHMYDGWVEEKEQEGGRLMLPYKVYEHNKCLADFIPDVMEAVFGNPLLDAKILVPAAASK